MFSYPLSVVIFSYLGQNKGHFNSGYPLIGLAHVCYGYISSLFCVLVCNFNLGLFNC